MKKLILGDELFDTAKKEVTMVVTSTALLHGRMRVLCFKTNSEQLIPFEDLRSRIGDGTLTVQRKGLPMVSPAHQADAGLDDAIGRALRVTKIVRDYCRRYQVSVCAAYEKVKAKQMCDSGADVPASFPSRPTVYRYLKSERSGQPLLCGNKNKGNRTPRHDERVVDLIAQVAKEQYLQTESRWSIRALTEACVLKAHDEGLLQPSSNISRKFVQKVIFERLSTDSELDRMDPRDRAAQRAIAKDRIRVNGILQRVEQDAVHLPWCVRTEAGDAKNIWLVHAIDCATSMPVGWKLVVGSPNESTGLQCVESILFSKKERFTALGLDIDIDLYGTPARIALDNGPEAVGERMRRLPRLGIDPQYCKSRHPQHKPFIERLNGSLKNGLETLPGCTRLDGTDGQRDPEKLNDLPMSLLELEQWIVRWYYSVWANTVLTRLVRTIFVDDRDFGATPLARYEAIVKRDGYAIPLPPNPDSWRLTKYDHEVRTLSRTTGITYKDFNFRGPNLGPLIETYGQKPVTILVDPEDFRTVLVVDGKNLVKLVNIDVDERSPAYSFNDAKMMVNEVKVAATATSAPAVNKFKQDLFARSSHTSSQQAKPKKQTATERARGVASRARTQSAVERGRAKPLPARESQSAAAGELSLDGVASLPVLNRKTGATV